MKNVYLWKAGDHVLHHTDLGAAAELDGLSRQPDMTMPLAEFEVAGCLARIVSGKIVIGKTLDEIAEEEEQERIAEYKQQLAQIDQDAMSGRAIRDLVLAMAEKLGIEPDEKNENDPLAVLQRYENTAEPIRAELSPMLKAQEAKKAAKA